MDVQTLMYFNVMYFVAVPKIPVQLPLNSLAFFLNNYYCTVRVVINLLTFTSEQNKPSNVNLAQLLMLFLPLGETGNSHQIQQMQQHEVFSNYFEQ